MVILLFTGHKVSPTFNLINITHRIDALNQCKATNSYLLCQINVIASWSKSLSYNI